MPTIVQEKLAGQEKLATPGTKKAPEARVAVVKQRLGGLTGL
jgi:hypothetical protein